MIETSQQAYEWMHDVFNLPRSLTGRGIKATLRSIKDNLANPEYSTIYQCRSGTKIFDWVVPEEWDFNRCQILDEQGNNLIDEHLCLQVINFSTYFSGRITGQQLLSISNIGNVANPDRIPYVTSYYKPSYGFCLSYNQSLKINPDQYYRVLIDTNHRIGHLEFLEYVLPGATNKEVLFSTYCCHPELANNELSGPALAMLIANQISKLKNRKYTYRFYFGPETIGSLVYLSKRGWNFKKKLTAGYILSCVGKTSAPCIITSRSSNSYSDKVAELAYSKFDNFQVHSQLKRGSDERQYCSPSMNLPVTVITGHRFGDYDQYHTSDDNLDFTSVGELEIMRQIVSDIVYILEHDETYLSTSIGEPMLSRYSLMPGLNNALSNSKFKSRMTKNVVHYSSGEHCLSEIALLTGSNFKDLNNIALVLKKKGKLIQVGSNRLVSTLLRNLLVSSKLLFSSIIANFSVRSS